MTQKICNFTGDHRFLSNFHPAPVDLDGVTYLTVEHAYQAAKTADQTERTIIRNADSPGEAKRTGRRVTMRPDWEEVKVDVMRDLLQQKFGPDRSAAHSLMDTGTAYLEEGNSWNDTFWGVCRGTGQNMLGRLLMEIREDLRMVMGVRTQALLERRNRQTELLRSALVTTIDRLINSGTHLEGCADGLGIGCWCIGLPPGPDGADIVKKLVDRADRPRYGADHD